METLEAELSQDVQRGPSPSAMAEAGLFLRAFLGPAREAGATPAAQIDAYRLLLVALEGRLGDPGFARALHAEWIRLSLGALARGARRWAR